jgi:alpha-D-ribose 1-methylphosphonate 5-triphosphate diphosphatase
MTTHSIGVGEPASLASETSFMITDARIVLADRVVPVGWVAINDGRIAEVGEGRPPERGVSLAGDTLIPGLVELHTDHLESHLQPRPTVRWNATAGVLAYDAQIAAAGITTVYDCVRVGTDGDNLAPDLTPLFDTADALLTTAEQGFFRAEHRTHLRCEVCSANVLTSAAQFLARYPVGLISLMDHTPGQRQFRDSEKLKVHYRGRLGYGEDQLQAFFQQRLDLFEKNAVTHRRRLIEMARRHRIALASHDDTTLAHVEESIADGACIAEFPTTVEAAAACHAAGIAVMMGAPNLVRGGSHSGNVAAEELARAGTLDILSSDYVPASLLLAAFELPERVPAIKLAAAVAMVTAAPAKSVGLADRGIIAAGLRADLVRVHTAARIPVVRTVWREGRRVI